MDTVWESIRKDVEENNWDTNGLQDLFNKQVNSVLLKEPVVTTICRNGDIVVGFYNESLQTKVLHLTIGGIMISDLEVKSGEFVYFFENTHAFPIISLVYSELKVTTESCEGLYVVYALIKEQELRRDIASSANIFHFRSGRKAVLRGNFSYIDGDIDSYLDIQYPNVKFKHIEIPDMRA